MTNDKKKNETKIISHVPWGVHLIIAFILGILAGYLIATNTYSGMYRAYYSGGYYAGLIILCISIVFDILALKSLITEAHVKALEVFYGKARAVKNGFGELVDSLED